MFGRFLYNWASLIVYVLVISVGIFTFFATLNQNINLCGIHSYFYALLACIVPVVIHEMSHAFTCFHYKRTIYDSGFMFYMFIPAFYVNTSDVWMEERGKRFIVSFSGPTCDVFMGSLFAVIYTYYGQSPYIYLISCMSFARGLLNLTPTFKMGWVLLPYGCFRHLQSFIIGEKLSFQIYPSRIYKSKTFALSRKEMVLLIYGFLSRLFFIYFIGVLIVNTFTWVVNIYCGKPITFTASLIISVILLGTLLLNFLKYFIERITVVGKIVFLRLVSRFPTKH